MWTALFGACVAALFTVLGFLVFARTAANWGGTEIWLRVYGKNLVISMTVVVFIHLLFDLGGRWLVTPQRLQGWRDSQRVAYFAGLPTLGVMLGWPLGATLAGDDVLAWLGTREGTRNIAISLGLSAVLIVVLYRYWSAKARQYDLERRSTEAQLRLLQAQIEPHFLFNTLAHVQSLMDEDLPKARVMLQSFTDYLRSSLGALRRSECALSQELQLAQNYLQLQQARMEDRLRFSITADASLSTQPILPLLLQPLVENAVVHGLEPSVQGGSIRITAQAHGDSLVLEVSDDGVGLPAAAGPAARPAGTDRRAGGLALHNIRERLQARFGSGARLDITPLNPGTRARITMPLQPTTAP
jgi:two-component sensor histidine kinase